MREAVETRDTQDAHEQARLAEQAKVLGLNLDLGLEQILSTRPARLWLWKLLLDLGIEGVAPRFSHQNVTELTFYQSGMRGVADKIRANCKRVSPDGWIQMERDGLELERTFSAGSEGRKRKRGRRGGRLVRERQGRPDDDGSGDDE